MTSANDGPRALAEPNSRESAENILRGAGGLGDGQSRDPCGRRLLGRFDGALGAAFGGEFGLTRSIGLTYRTLRVHAVSRVRAFAAHRAHFAGLRRSEQRNRLLVVGHGIRAFCAPAVRKRADDACERNPLDGLP